MLLRWNGKRTTVTTLEHRYQKIVPRLVPTLLRWNGKRTMVTTLEHRYQKTILRLVPMATALGREPCHGNDTGASLPEKNLRLVPMLLRWNEKKKMTQW
jgi:hypothetical protein